MENLELFKKRSDLILDYISQILVYGSNTNGNISINKSNFDDGKYLVLTVNVLKNSYFRWHDLGITATSSVSFYKYVINSILDKFKTFDIIITDNTISISSKVNKNRLDISFTLTTKKEKEMFLKQKDLFYNNIK